MIAEGRKSNAAVSWEVLILQVVLIYLTFQSIMKTKTTATTYMLLLVLSASIQQVVSCLREILVDDTATTRPQTYPLVLSLGQNLDNCFRVVASDTNKYEKGEMLVPHVGTIMVP